MNIYTAASNFSFDDLGELAEQRIKPQIDYSHINTLYYPFYTSVFILDDVEELLVAFDAVSGTLIREEDGIKINISGSRTTQRNIPDDRVILPEFDKNNIPGIVIKRVKYKTVKYVKTDLVYFPCICLPLNTQFGKYFGRKYLLFNTSSATFHILGYKILKSTAVNFESNTNKGNASKHDAETPTLQSIEAQSQARAIKLPLKSASCFVDKEFVIWLINHKMAYRNKNVSITKINLSYEPFYIFKYYARRVRALKSYTYCSVNALKGTWSPHAHKVLEYDTLKNKGIIPPGEYEFNIEKVSTQEEIAIETATTYIQKNDGVLNVRFNDSQIVYLPVWNLELQDTHRNQYTIEICGVTGYVVAERRHQLC